MKAPRKTRVALVVRLMAVHDNVAPVSKIEVEVKLRLTDAATFQARLLQAGARLLHPREFEDNLVYDFPDRTLTQRGALLRVRLIERQAVLTFKDRARFDSGAKVREEVESTLPRPEAESLIAILGKIGLAPIFRYQKYRTTWSSEGLLITLDETPIGDFIELEGNKGLIDRMAEHLGHGPQDFITASYRDLYLQSLEERSGPLDQMVFTS